MELWSGIIQFIIHILVHQFNSSSPCNIPIQFQRFLRIVPNSKKFHAGKSYTMYFFNISTIIGVSSSIFVLVYLAFKPWITCAHDELLACRLAQTHPVLELDRTIEFHHETLIPFAALVICMQIDSHLFFVLTLYPGCYILSV